MLDMEERFTVTTADDSDVDDMFFDADETFDDIAAISASVTSCNEQQRHNKDVNNTNDDVVHSLVENEERKMLATAEVILSCCNVKQDVIRRRRMSSILHHNGDSVIDVAEYGHIEVNDESYLSPSTLSSLAMNRSFSCGNLFERISENRSVSSQGNSRYRCGVKQLEGCDVLNGKVVAGRPRSSTADNGLLVGDTVLKIENHVVVESIKKAGAAFTMLVMSDEKDRGHNHELPCRVLKEPPDILNNHHKNDNRSNMLAVAKSGGLVVLDTSEHLNTYVYSNAPETMNQRSPAIVATTSESMKSSCSAVGDYFTKYVVVRKNPGERLGVIITTMKEGGLIPSVFVSHIFPGGPCTRSKGLCVGDQLVTVNGTSVVGKNLAQTQCLLKAASVASEVYLYVLGTPGVRMVRLVKRLANPKLGFSLHGSKIVSICPGGLADKNGNLRVGDHIIEVNSINMVGASQAHLIETLNQIPAVVLLSVMSSYFYNNITSGFSRKINTAIC